TSFPFLPATSLAGSKDDRADDAVPTDLGDRRLGIRKQGLPQPETEHDRVRTLRNRDRRRILEDRPQRDDYERAGLDLRSHLVHLILHEAQAQIPQVEDARR